MLLANGFESWGATMASDRSLRLPLLPSSAGEVHALNGDLKRLSTLTRRPDDKSGRVPGFPNRELR